jgi:hypothetical protein
MSVLAFIFPASPLADTWFFPALGLAALVMGGLALGWASALQSRCNTPGTIIFLRPRWLLIASTFVLMICSALPLFVPITSDNIAVVLLPALFALLFYASGLVNVLLFFVADQSGLTRHILFLKKTLPWHAIDWVYGAQTTTSHKAYGLVAVAKTTEQKLIVEAGPRQRLSIPLRDPFIRTKPGPLIEAIQERASNALWGYDQWNEVRKRRQTTISHHHRNIRD